MKTVYFTITGTRYYHGQEFFQPGMTVKLQKEPDNVYDSEAILVKVKGLGTVGYVANSPRTVCGESMSAGRLYDKIGSGAKGIVRHITERGVICELVKKKRRK